MDSTITLNGESFTIGDTTLSDNVNSPDHYNFAGIECIDAIRAATGSEGFDSYLQGNIMKYLWRYQYKNGVEDLKKAQWYLSRLIEAQDVS
jgi:hypothetical protein|tara:strand:+ start:199 stop:471 length:273 start_codon:yes stop_codon:yes gene_type:complete